MDIPPKLKAAAERYEASRAPLGRALFSWRSDDPLFAAQAEQNSSVVDLVLEGLQHFAEITAQASKEAKERSLEADRRANRQANVMIFLTIAIFAATAFSAYAMFRQDRDIERAQVARPIP